MPEIDEVDPEPQLSAAPDRRGLRRRLRPRHRHPLRRRAGAARHGAAPSSYAGESLRESVVVFNGDVLHGGRSRARSSRCTASARREATIVLTPVDNPAAYGLVETDAAGNIRRFLEKPNAGRDHAATRSTPASTCSSPTRFDRIPQGHATGRSSASYFPSLIERRETFVAYVYRGYWIDIGTPEKYMQVHRDIMDGRFVSAAPFAGHARRALGVARSPRSRRAPSIEAPCFIDEGDGRQARRAHRRLQRRRTAVPHRGARRHRARDSVAEHAGRQRGASSATRSSAAIATSAATSQVDDAARSSATSPVRHRLLQPNV